MRSLVLVHVEKRSEVDGALNQRTLPRLQRHCNFTLVLDCNPDTMPCEDLTDRSSQQTSSILLHVSER